MTIGKVLVTGATGFVGRALVGEALARRLPVRGAVRTAGSRCGAESVIVGEAHAAADWSGALQGCESVVHLANLAHASAGAEQIQRINVDGTLRLAEQAHECGLRRLVFVSSIKALAEASGDRPLREDDAPAPCDAYGRAKLAAERALRRFSLASGLEVSILRPPLAYGAGVRANFLALLRAIARGLPLPVASIDNRRSLIYLGNLCDAILACVLAPQAAGRTYHVSDGAALSPPALVRAIAAALGRPARLLPCPPALLESLAAAIGRPETAKRLTRSRELDDSAIRHELGWQPPYSFTAGLDQTVRWFRGRNGADS